ncbi:hypothetical protein OC834_003841 [Tilletia horrida]|uniref:Acyl-CoA thioesterase II n=1 Tax=Tilletia horrida TaxID=155126 RepID=A0AAN6GGI4_9BASI|nr:hypothetical protein OC835_005390 [Tilletia horrida]KAK0529014.1 hypothetical protein OC834_003841 [Tilletia horrida]KAK0536134.1 hypothetical protein OC842_002082 [Tilletia horrida]
MADDEEYDASEPPTSFYEFIALKPGSSSSSSASSSSGSRPPRDFYFSTVYPPRPFGSAIAFGGSVLVAAVQAGFCALQQTAGSVEAAEAYQAYSLQGSFTGPSSVDRSLDLHVQTLRFTRSFATFLVTVSQPDRKGRVRKNMVATFDFVRPVDSLLRFGPAPKDPVSGQPWATPDKLISYYDEIEKRAEEGIRKPQAIAIERLAVYGWQDILEIRLPPESYLAQTLGSLVPTLPTTQDHLAPTDKRSSDWSRYTTPLTREGITADKYAARGMGITPTSANIAALTHLADTRLAWIPSGTAKVPLKHLEFTATLDFSLRYHQRDIRADEWMLREMRSITAGEGRSFGESRFWDRQGRLLATMSQQCLLRPHRENDAKAIKLKL